MHTNIHINTKLSVSGIRYLLIQMQKLHKQIKTCFVLILNFHIASLYIQM